MFTFKVSTDGAEPYILVAGSRDVAVWEKTAKGRTLADLQRPAMGDFYGIAYIAARRLGLTESTTRADFEATSDLEIDPDDEDEEPDPTPPAP